MAQGTINLQGRSIEPQRARGRSGGGGRSGGIKKVFVGGVDPDVSEAEIRDYFSSFGRVSNAIAVCTYSGQIALFETGLRLCVGLSCAARM